MIAGPSAGERLPNRFVRVRMMVAVDIVQDLSAHREEGIDIVLVLARPHHPPCANSLLRYVKTATGELAIELTAIDCRPQCRATLVAWVDPAVEFSKIRY